MRLRTALLPLLVVTVTVLAPVACAPSDGTASPPPEEREGAEEDAGAAMMAAAVHQLLTVDHTFGDGAPPFTEYLLQAHTDPAAGTATGAGPARPLTEAEMAAIEDAVSALGPIRWIDDPDEWRTDDLRPTIDGAVIVGVGEPTIDGTEGLVPVSLWCGGLCGTWLTYQLELDGGTWVVTGIDGPIAIS